MSSVLIHSGHIDTSSNSNNNGSNGGGSVIHAANGSSVFAFVHARSSFNASSTTTTASASSSSTTTLGSDGRKNSEKQTVSLDNGDNFAMKQSIEEIVQEIMQYPIPEQPVSPYHPSTEVGTSSSKNNNSKIPQKIPPKSTSQTKQLSRSPSAIPLSPPSQTVLPPQGVLSTSPVIAQSASQTISQDSKTPSKIPKSASLPQLNVSPPTSNSSTTPEVSKAAVRTQKITENQDGTSDQISENPERKTHPHSQLVSNSSLANGTSATVHPTSAIDVNPTSSDTGNNTADSSQATPKLLLNNGRVVLKWTALGSAPQTHTHPSVTPLRPSSPNGDSEAKKPIVVRVKHQPRQSKKHVEYGGVGFSFIDQDSMLIACGETTIKATNGVVVEGNQSPSGSPPHPSPLLNPQNPPTAEQSAKIAKTTLLEEVQAPSQPPTVEVVKVTVTTSPPPTVQNSKASQAPYEKSNQMLVDEKQASSIPVSPKHSSSPKSSDQNKKPTSKSAPCSPAINNCEDTKLNDIHANPPTDPQKSASALAPSTPGPKVIKSEEVGAVQPQTKLRRKDGDPCVHATPVIPKANKAKSRSRSKSKSKSPAKTQSRSRTRSRNRSRTRSRTRSPTQSRSRSKGRSSSSKTSKRNPKQHGSQLRRTYPSNAVNSGSSHNSDHKGSSHRAHHHTHAHHHHNSATPSRNSTSCPNNSAGSHALNNPRNNHSSSSRSRSQSRSHSRSRSKSRSRSRSKSRSRSRSQSKSKSRSRTQSRSKSRSRSRSTSKSKSRSRSRTRHKSTSPPHPNKHTHPGHSATITVNTSTAKNNQPTKTDAVSHISVTPPPIPVSSSPSHKPQSSTISHSTSLGNIKALTSEKISTEKVVNKPSSSQAHSTTQPQKTVQSTPSPLHASQHHTVSHHSSTTHHSSDHTEKADSGALTAEAVKLKHIADRSLQTEPRDALDFYLYACLKYLAALKAEPPTGDAEQLGTFMERIANIALSKNEPQRASLFFKCASMVYACRFRAHKDKLRKCNKECLSNFKQGLHIPHQHSNTSQLPLPVNLSQHQNKTPPQSTHNVASSPPPHSTPPSSPPQQVPTSGTTSAPPAASSTPPPLWCNTPSIASKSGQCHCDVEDLFRSEELWMLSLIHQGSLPMFSRAAVCMAPPGFSEPAQLQHHTTIAPPISLAVSGLFSFNDDMTALDTYVHTCVEQLKSASM
ncbi:hypothetical protein Pelo_8326 [Pelomyxa schiedti]|nr:hypothetical protein Pelo_8326 [Pelomyxa schiedti]